MARRPPTDPYRAGLDDRRAAAYDRLVELLGRRDRRLPDYLACGQALAALRPADATYGSGWVKEVRDALARRKVTLSLSLAYRLLLFASHFPGREGSATVRRLAKTVSWEVMLRVLPLEDSDRNMILRRAAKEKLPSREVIELVRGSGGESSTRPTRALRRLRTLTEKWSAVYAVWSRGDANPLGRARQLSPAQVTPKFLDKLEATVVGLGKMAREAKDLEGELSALQSALTRQGRR